MTLQEGFSPFSGQMDYLARFREQHAQSTLSIFDTSAPSTIQVTADRADPAATNNYQPNHGAFDSHVPSAVATTIPVHPYPTPQPSIHRTSINYQITPNTPAGTPDDPALEQTNAQQKAAAAKFFDKPRQASISRSSPSSSSSTPDAMIGLPLNATVDSKSPNPYGRPLPHHGLLNGSTNLNGDQGVNGPDAASNVTVDPVDSISQTLGEFLFTPKTVIEGIPPSPTAQSMASKKQRTRTDTGGSDIPLNKTLIPMESDGLTDAVRESL